MKNLLQNKNRNKSFFLLDIFLSLNKVNKLKFHIIKNILTWFFVVYLIVLVVTDLILEQRIKVETVPKCSKIMGFDFSCKKEKEIKTCFGFTDIFRMLGFSEKLNCRPLN